MTEDLVLWLDLADANQLADQAVLEHVPPEAKIRRLTEHHAAQYPGGTPHSPAQWRAVLDAIDQLVLAARKLEKQAPGCRYWVTGRAGLPAFFYLGYRLSRVAACTFVHQPKNGAEVTVMPLDAPSSAAGGPSYFERTPWPVPHTESAAPAALVISSVRRPAEHPITKALSERKLNAARIVHAHAPARLDVSTIIPAMHEIDELIQRTCDAHPARSTLAVFIAGPTPLGFMAGTAVNPRACRDAQIYEFDGSRYSLAYELPYPPVPERNKVLFFRSSPTGTSKLKLDEEIRGIHLERSNDKGADRLVIEDIPAARPKDVFDELRMREPGVVHFSGHGKTEELLFQDDNGHTRPLPISDLVEILRLAGSSVHLVVLNACYSASHAEALFAHVPCVVAMHGPVWDTDARRFSATFYRHLAEGDSVRDAFDKAFLDMRLARSAGAVAAGARDVVIDDPEPRAPTEPPQLLERSPGCASTLFLVRRR